MRASRPHRRILRAAAFGAVAAGIAAPIVRRRAGIPRPVVAAATMSAPIGLCIAIPRSRLRDIATCCLQMWGYVACYEMPNDDPVALRERVRIDYPVRIDQALGLGEMPGVRLQRRLGTPGRVKPLEQVLVWAHWLWFFFPHGTALYHLLFKSDRFEHAATHIYGTFDVGVVFYWLLPTAPPWYAAEQGRAPAMRRIMVEHGEDYWGERWEALYGSLGGNPLAAMPSLHFATSVSAARLLAELGPRRGAFGWTYTATLGLALVYLGEHYVIDLIAGYALSEAISLAGPAATPALSAVKRVIEALEREAQG